MCIAVVTRTDWTMIYTLSPSRIVGCNWRTRQTSAAIRSTTTSSVAPVTWPDSRSQRANRRRRTPSLRARPTRTATRPWACRVTTCRRRARPKSHPTTRTPTMAWQTRYRRAARSTTAITLATRSIASRIFNGMLVSCPWSGKYRITDVWCRVRVVYMVCLSDALLLWWMAAAYVRQTL